MFPPNERIGFQIVHCDLISLGQRMSAPDNKYIGFLMNQVKSYIWFSLDGTSETKIGTSFQQLGDDLVRITGVQLKLNTGVAFNERTHGHWQEVGTEYRRGGDLDFTDIKR
jgi:hypothetical protein